MEPQHAQAVRSLAGGQVLAGLVHMAVLLPLMLRECCKRDTLSTEWEEGWRG